MRRFVSGFALLSSVVVLLAGLVAPAAAAAEQTQPPREPLSTDMGSYPRLIRLEHSGPTPDRRIVAAMTSKDERGHFTPIFQSTDEGASFDQIGEIRDEEGVSGMCCGTLYELPVQVGGLRAGTLLWAASYGQQAGPDRRIGIKVWASNNGGHDWSFLSEPARSHNHDGVWEPEFDVDAGGQLWMHFADETEAPRHAQVLNRVSTTDGVNWGTKQPTLAIPPDPVRPGMPQIRRLRDGSYYFGYELCNYGDRFCDPYFKISKDGANFGDPNEPGTRVQTAEKNHFEHAQTISLFPNDKILMVGQIYTDESGKPLPGNGKTLLANDNSGNGPWHEVPAPVQVNEPHDDWCLNYSSTLLPVDGGSNVLEAAADYDQDGVCRVYFGKGAAS